MHTVLVYFKLPLYLQCKGIVGIVLYSFGSRFQSLEPSAENDLCPCVVFQKLILQFQPAELRVILFVLSCLFINLHKPDVVLL